MRRVYILFFWIERAARRAWPNSVPGRRTTGRTDEYQLMTTNVISIYTIEAKQQQTSTNLRNVGSFYSFARRFSHAKFHDLPLNSLADCGASEIAAIVALWPGQALSRRSR